MSTLLEVSGVSVTFDGFKAINNLSFQIGEPELRAIIGPNGAGKTTFMDIVTGKTRPDEGRVLWGERTIAAAMSESQIAREGDRPQVPAPDRVRGSDGAGQPADGAEEGPRALRGAVLYRRRGCRPGRVELAEEIGLADAAARKAGELSHGQKQWLEIGMLLAQEPRLLLVDEPAAGMTPAEREHTTDLLKSRPRRPAPWWWWNTTWNSSAGWTAR
jgi:urea transport system ATP-binding protein